MTRLGPGGYTRGWETIGHYLAMLRASIRTHLFLSLLLGLLVGSLWFYLGLGDARPFLGSYLKAAVLSSLDGDRTAKFDLGPDDPLDVPAALASQVLAEKFGGRSVGFLAKQWSYRLVVCLLIAGLVSLVLASGLGNRMAEDQHRRGAIAVDFQRDRGRARAKQIAVRAGVSAALGLLVLLLILSLFAEKSGTLGDYVWSSTYLAMPPIARIASPDGSGRIAWYSTPEPGFYDSQQLNDALRANVFGGLSVGLLSLCWLGLSLLAGLGIMFFEKWRLNRSISGPGQGRESAPIRIADVELRPGSECEHFLFAGSPGSGKSTAIKDLLDQVRARGQRAIVFDASGEYIELYYRQGRDKILNPLDQRGEVWNLWADIREPTDYQTIARSLFPQSGRDPFWADAGSALFAATAEQLAAEKKASNRKLYELLTTSPIEVLAELLAGTAASKFLDKSAGAMPSNLIATVTAKVGAWRLLPDPTEDQTPFSLRRFVEDESHDGWLFLAMRQDHEAALRPLVSLWCDLAATAILSLPPDRERRFWVALDEVASLQRLPALEPIMAKGRKHGAAVVLGLQSMAQLRDLYGRDAAEALASQPQTWLALRSVEPGTAKWLEQALGEAEVGEARESVSMGADPIRDGVNLSQQVQRRSVAMAAELMTLPALEGFLKLSGSPEIYRVKLSHRDRQKRAAIYVPRHKPEETKACSASPT